MNKPTIIQFIEGSDATGGAEKIGFTTAKLLSEAGYRVVVVSSAAEVKFMLPHVSPHDIHCLDLKFLWDDFFASSKPEMLRTLTSASSRGERISSLLTNFDPTTTLVHFHGFHNQFSFAGLHAAIKAGFKTILTAHDYGLICPNSTFYNYPEGRICDLKPLGLGCLKCYCVSSSDNKYKQYRFAQAWGGLRLKGIHKKLSAILSVSKFEHEVLVRHLGHQKNLSVLENPISVPKDIRTSADSRKGLLWVGRITEEKDLLTALKAAQQSKFELTVIGDGPLRTALQNEYPLIKFMGWQDENSVFEALKKSRGLLLTSKWYETASLIALESLALGTPVAIPSTCAATSWIQDGVDSLTFTGGSVDSLQQVADRYISDEFEVFSDRAYANYWSSPYTNERYLKALEAKYDEVLKS